MRNKPLILAVLIPLAVWVTPAWSNTIVFSNLIQPGDQYGPDGVGIGHTPSYPPGVTGHLMFAVRFSPAVDAYLTSMAAPLGYGGLGPNRLDLYLLSDIGGLPGSTLESFVLQSLPVPPGFLPLPLTTITSISNPFLQAGQSYWLAASAGPETFAWWTLNLFQGDPNSGGATRTIVDGVDSGWSAGTGTRTGALVVNGQPIPEPSSSALAGLAILGLVVFRRGRC